MIDHPFRQLRCVDPSGMNLDSLLGQMLQGFAYLLGFYVVFVLAMVWIMFLLRYWDRGLPVSSLLNNTTSTLER